MNLRHFASLAGIKLLVAKPTVYHRTSNLTLCDSRQSCLSFIVRMYTEVVSLVFEKYVHDGHVYDPRLNTWLRARPSYQ